MSSHTPPGSSESSPVSTRQLLEELDALMQRMLSLPVNQPEKEKEDEAALLASAAVLEKPPRRRPAAAPAPTAPPQRSASPPAAGPEAAPDLPPSEEVEYESAAEEPATREEPGMVEEPPASPRPVPPVRRRPVEAEESREPESDEPDFDEPAFESSPRLPTPVGADVLNALRSQPEDSEPAVPSGPVPVPLRLKPPTPWWLGPFVWINRAFDWTTHCLGPLGRWLRSRAGRNVLGWCGVLMLLVALGWQVLLWCGWL